MALEGVNALSGAHIPNLGRVVEGSSHHLIAVCVEVERNDLCVVTFKTENLLARLNIPQLGSVVHGASADKHAVGVE